MPSFKAFTKRERELYSLANEFHWLAILYRNEMGLRGVEPTRYILNEGRKLERRKARLLGLNLPSKLD